MSYISDNQRIFFLFDELKKEKRITNYVELAQIIGTNKAGISDLKSGRKKISLDHVKSMINSYPDINPDWLLTGKGEMFRIKDRITQVAAEPEVSYQKGTPMYPAEAFAGKGMSHYNDFTADRYYKVYEFRGADFLITVKGVSMQPQYCGGDIVACKLIRDRLFIQWNKPHIIYTESQGILLKRIKKGSDSEHYTLTSDNPDFAPFEVPIRDIIDIAIVIGVIHTE